MSPLQVLTNPVNNQNTLSRWSLPIDNAFDPEFANQIARLESFNKHLYRPNTYLHKWWARRCGTTFRLILKSLVEQENYRDFYVSGGLEGKLILDPMMGGGTTLHEAIRMGANVIGVDIDPIPVLQVRASLSSLSLPLLEEAFTFFYQELYKQLSSFFLTTCPSCECSTDIQFTLYGLQRLCECSRVLFVDSLVLRCENDDSETRLCPNSATVFTSRNMDCNCKDSSSSEFKIIEKGTKECPYCRTQYQDMKDVPFYNRYLPIAVVGTCPKHGRFFKKPGQLESASIAHANSLRSILGFNSKEDFSVQPGPKSTDLIRNGVSSYLELFSSKQLLYLNKAIDLLDSFEPLLRLNFALLVSTSLEFNSMLCGYKGAEKRRPGAVRHTFSHHAYSFPYTALENNPLYPVKASGTLQALFHSRIRKARQWAQKPKEKLIKKGQGTSFIELSGEVDFGTEVQNFKDLCEGKRRFLLIQNSSTSLNLPSNSVDYVVTDPPYFDNVQYGDLAAFFHVWLKEFLPNAAAWKYDINESAVDPQSNGSQQYAQILSGIFSECHRVLKSTGRLVFTFHHWNPKGWAALTLALKRAHFTLVNFYIVHSENPTSVHISGLKSLKHDAILVMASNQAGILAEWKLPQQINKTDSLKFSEDCANILGWMLTTNLEEHHIESSWIKFFEK